MEVGGEVGGERGRGGRSGREGEGLDGGEVSVLRSGGSFVGFELFEVEVLDEICWEGVEEGREGR